MKLPFYRTMGILVWVNIALLSQIATAKTKELDFKKIKWSLLTLDDDMGGVLIDGDQLIAWPHLGTSFATTTFHPEAKTQNEVFGAKNSVNSPLKRVQIPGQKRPLSLGTLMKLSDGRLSGQFLALDNRDAQLYTIEPKTFTLQAQDQIILDQAAPPKDPRGEPTSQETVGLRGRLRQAIKHVIEQPLLAGLVSRPAFFKDTDGFLVWSNIPGFPLFTASCLDTDGFHCQLQRSCDIENIGTLKSVSWSSFSVSSKRGLFLVANRTSQSIEIFRGNTCWKIRHEATLSLPKQLGKIRNVHVDGEDRLWISTQHIDDYLNASLYAWDSADW